MNKIISKPFLKSLFWKQNKHHQHGVFLHTLRVVYYTIKFGDFKLIPAAIFHDIGKPFVAFQKEEDIELDEFSFTDHEEESYQIIKKWFFLSDYTKHMVRYHYLIRDVYLCEKKGKLDRFKEKKDIWDSLSNDYKKDLERFIKYDDFGKGHKTYLKNSS